MDSCWDPRSHNWWIKEGPKRGIFGSFSECVRPCKSLYIRQWSLFWIKQGMCFLHVPSILKEIRPKTFWLHCVLLFLGKRKGSMQLSSYVSNWWLLLWCVIMMAMRDGNKHICMFLHRLLHYSSLQIEFPPVFII